MNRVTHFVHLTDLHITDPATPDSHLYSDTAATLEQVKQMLDLIEPQPQFVVVSGDLTNHGSPESFAALKDQLASIDVPVLLALGNHDQREPFYQTFLQQRSSAPFCYGQVLGHLHVIVLDSSAPGQVDGSIESEQFAWLEAELQQHPQHPKLVVVHHPPCPIEFSIFDHITFKRPDAERLGELLAAHGVVGVLSGHVHFDRFAMWKGVPYVIGAGLHNLTDVLQNDGIRATSGGSFNLCRVQEDQLTVTTVHLPSDQRQLHHVRMDALRKYMSHLEAQAR